jgi:hypothetical protein
MSNVKAGDRAIIIRSDIGNLGRVVQVVEERQKLRPGDCYKVSGIKWIADTPGLVWLCESEGSALNCPGGGMVSVRPIPDWALRPLRDTDGADEVLLIAQRKDDSKVPA